MLEINEIKELADKKEYTKVFNHFYDEYTDIMHDFLERHEVKLNSDDTLINYILKTRIFMPDYSRYTIPIANIMYNENITEEKKYELLMKNYSTLKNIFSE